MRLKPITIFLALGLFLLMSGMVAAQEEYAGAISIESRQVLPGDLFTLSVSLTNNDVALSAMLLPIKFDSPYLILDSVSLAGTIWGAEFFANSFINNDEHTARILVTPSSMPNPLPVAEQMNGDIARLFFHMDDLAIPHIVMVDSFYIDTLIGGSIHVITQVELTDNTGYGSYKPEFQAGEVVVESPTDVGDNLHTGVLPDEYVLEQNYPNPFNPTTSIGFALPTSGQVRLDVFNILGQQVDQLVAGYMEAGRHSVSFDAGASPSGIYFYRLTAEGVAMTRKMILVK